MNLTFYEDSFSSVINRYTITDEQLRYTVSPIEAIQLAKEDKDRFPILALENDRLVTFFVLHRNEGVRAYSSNENSILIRSFSTDFYQQGKGFAKRVLLLLPAFVRCHFQEVNELVLAVNVGNDVAKRLYESCGFVDNGVRIMGIKGELIVMSYYLKSDDTF
ncbi:GNAT family N-acetyltransferase [Lysinibacillus sp. 54212]|uniref:GNAT family N-acetyltransferase n=1 Tax=Lysinibacillus sp. 54212 TaxID=3119829 RepID=UPI002FCB523E